MDSAAYHCFRDNPLADQSENDRHCLAPPSPRFASNDSSDGEPSRIQHGESDRCNFAVFRADSVSVTSTQFAGGDWRWQLSDQKGTILAEAGGYRSETHCRETVAILQAHAARAAVG